MICLIGWMTVHAHGQAEGACALLALVLLQQCCIMARCCVAHAGAATHFGRRSATALHALLCRGARDERYLARSRCALCCHDDAADCVRLRSAGAMVCR